MKKLSALLALMVACSCHSKQDPYRNMHPHGEFGYKLFEKQDINKDNTITLDELSKHHQKMFNKVDKNRDGKITRLEARKNKFEEDFNQMIKSTKKSYLTIEDTFITEEKRFKDADRDGDGRITKKEFKAQYLRSFATK